LRQRFIRRSLLITMIGTVRSQHRHTSLPQPRAKDQHLLAVVKPAGFRY
jgi:hypothetical protein